MTRETGNKLYRLEPRYCSAPPAARCVVTLLCSLLAASSASGRSNDREPPWRIPPEVRVSNWLLAASDQAEKSTTDPLAPATLAISGRDRVDLFFSWQLFDYVLRNAFSTDSELRRAFRAALEVRAAALGFGADIWDKLEAASDPFLRNRRAQLEIVRSLGAGASEPLALERLSELASRDCALRHSAMRAAEHALGPDRFGSLLYDVAGPSFNLVVPLAELDPWRDQFIEEGCQ